MRVNRGVDRNQPEIVKALRAVGAVCISMTGDHQIGFDLLVAFRGKLFPAEVKDGTLSASRRKLTDTETARLEDLKRQGVRLLIWESTDQALRDIGAIK